MVYFNKNKKKNIACFRILSIMLILSLFFSSCNKDDLQINESIEISGTLEKQGVTTYMYGTHTLSGYALRSSSLDLDDYLNQDITVVGHKVDGYPVDGGPEYIEVEKVK